METLHRSNSPSVEFVRMTGDYHPSIWGDYFISIDPIPQKKLESLMLRKNELKEEILRMFKETTDSLQIMELIDLIQQLGVCYQFENEISKALCTIQKASACDYENDLNAVALHFRLLRHNRIYVPIEVFDKFLDENGDFKESLCADAKALLSLYEAAHMAMPNEDVMDKAIEFSKTNLEAMQCNLDPHLAKMVSTSLDVPLLRRTNRLKARIYLSIYEHDSQCNKVVLEFAKMDFLCLQAIYQEETRILSPWWSALEMSKRFPFSRDRLVECYFWVLSAYFEPCYSRGRLMMTKVITLMSILDDIYDNYGTIEELNLLTKAIQGWKNESLSELPDYMQHCFGTIFDVFKQYAAELEPENNSFRLEYIKYELKKVVNAYHQEAIWANKGYVPNLEEHLSVTLLTAGYSFLACASYMGMHENIPKDVFEWAISLPEIVKQSCVIGRVMNDIVSYEREQERTHVASTVHCYVKEHQCSEEDACTKLLEMTKNAWKIINKELVMHVKIPYFLVSPVLNLARYNDYVYHGKDIYTHSEDYMKERVHAILVEPIQIDLSKE